MAKEGVPLTQHKATHLSWSVSHPLGYPSLAGLCCRVEHTQDTQYLSLPSSLPVSLLYSLSSRRYVCISLGHLTGALEFIVQRAARPTTVHESGLWGELFCTRGLCRSAGLLGHMESTLSFEGTFVTEACGGLVH